MGTDDWIHVDHEKPPKNIMVLAWHDGQDIHSGLPWDRSGIWFAVWWGDQWNDRLLDQAKVRLGARQLEVTYWQPLPERPVPI